LKHHYEKTSVNIGIKSQTIANKTKQRNCHAKKNKDTHPSSSRWGNKKTSRQPRKKENQTKIEQKIKNKDGGRLDGSGDDSRVQEIRTSTRPRGL
jgi:hypothetical protein